MYIGRFAPSPTGPLHFGSLCCALASYLDAKANNGQWHLRIEDIDPPRCQLGADQQIINQLHQHGLRPDSIEFQSTHLKRYQTALASLIKLPEVYYCDCSRKDIIARGGHELGFCMARQHEIDTSNAAIRVQLAISQKWYDEIQGEQYESAAQTELILKRRDGIFAYPLAVVVDDIALNATHILRGYDLINVAAGQVALYHLLGARAPHFMHIPVASNPFGQKLSKQNKAPSLDSSAPEKNVYAALVHLNQSVPSHSPVLSDMLEHAVEHWDRTQIPASASVQAPDQLAYLNE